MKENCDKIDDNYDALEEKHPETPSEERHSEDSHEEKGGLMAYRGVEAI